MEHRLLGACGLDCQACPARVATVAKDAAMARRVAREWSDAYHVQVDVGDVWCDGCLVPGRKCAHCAECEIRTCAVARNVDVCGHCPEYASGCPRVEAFLRLVPGARENLDRARGEAARAVAVNQSA